MLTLDRADQAESRYDKGAEAVRTGLEMADLFANLRAAAARSCPADRNPSWDFRSRQSLKLGTYGSPGNPPFRSQDGNPSATIPSRMSKICSLCGKKPGFGNNRSHSMVATKRRFNPNLQRVRMMLDGKATRAYVCTRCLKAGKVTKAI